jgi:hypothetical protein
MKRKFKTNRICSSDNYKLSVKVSKYYIERAHIENTLLVEEIMSRETVSIQYVRVFGNIIPITLTEVEEHSTLHLIKY